MATQMISSNLPIGMMLNSIGAKQNHWAGGVTVTIQAPGEGPRQFRYDFVDQVWFEFIDNGSSKPISAAAVREYVGRIFASIQ